MPQISYVKTKEYFVEKHTLKKPQADMHYHHAYELYYIIEGEREYFIGDKFFKVNKGDLVIVPKEMLHRTAGKGATRILAFFSDKFLGNYFSGFTLEKIIPSSPFVYHPAKDDEEKLSALLSELVSRYESHVTAPAENDELLIAGVIFQILFLLFSTENEYSAKDDADESISKIVRYINENFTRITSIGEIADQSFISSYHLCHIFKKHLGVPLITYLNTLRIRYACELLRTGKYKMTEIADMCGFNSAPYFCKVFKDEKGVSPSEYKKNHEQPL